MEQASGVTRRRTLSGVAGVALSSVANAQAQAPETACGKLFEEGGAGLLGLMAVFVIKPTGFMTPVDPVTELPHFSTCTSRTFVEEVYARDPESKKPWVSPGPYTHL